MDRRYTTRNSDRDVDCSRTDECVPPVRPVVWDPNCSCSICQAFVSSSAMDRLESDLMELVGDVLAFGWTPNRLLAEVAHCATHGLAAEEVLTVALIAHASHWLSRPDKSDLLDEVDELADNSDFEVGEVIPGWLQQYATEDADIDVALGGVIDLFEILVGIPCPPPRRRRRPSLRSVPRA